MGGGGWGGGGGGRQRAAVGGGLCPFILSPFVRSQERYPRAGGCRGEDHHCRCVNPAAVGPLAFCRSRKWAICTPTPLLMRGLCSRGASWVLVCVCVRWRHRLCVDVSLYARLGLRALSACARVCIVLCGAAGVNGGSTPPKVPKIFKWVEPSTGDSVIAMWHPYGYGGFDINSVVSVRVCVCVLGGGGARSLPCRVMFASFVIAPASRGG